MGVIEVGQGQALTPRPSCEREQNRSSLCQPARSVARRGQHVEKRRDLSLKSATGCATGCLHRSLLSGTNAGLKRPRGLCRVTNSRNGLCVRDCAARSADAAYSGTRHSRAENQLRIVALGRKNWLFAGSFEGARRAALLYSLVQSCQLINTSPFEEIIPTN